MQSHVRNSLHALKDIPRVDARVFSPPTSSGWLSNARYLGVSYNGSRFRIPIGGSVKSVLSDLADFAPDVIEFGFPINPWFGSRVWRDHSGAARVLISHHTPDAGWKRTFELMVLRFLTPKLGAHDQQFAVGLEGGWFMEAVTRRPTPLQFPVLVEPQDQERLPSYKARTVDFALLGPFVPRKNHDFAVRALETLAQTARRSFSVVTIGDGPTYPSLMARLHHAEGLCLVGSLRHPSNDQRDSVLQDAKFALFPSRFGEGFGIALHEAAALGTVVLANNLPAYEAWLPASSICRADEQSWVERMRRLVENDELARCAGSACHSSAVHAFRASRGQLFSRIGLAA